MTVRCLVTAATTMMVALALAIVVPVAQLRTAVEKTPCCCPNPDTCKCKHKADPLQTSMKSCHRNAPDAESPTLPQFIPPTLVAFDAPSHPAISIVTPLPDPHPAPAPRRPDAPS